MKVLISAIACDPVRGSEALHGWMACRSLANIADLWLLVSGESKPGIDQARAKGEIPDNMHFTFIGGNPPYHPNRMLARFQGWQRNIQFNRQILPVACELHREIGFDLAHHVTYSTWRVACPLWRLGIPLIWGPISGTEVFPLLKLGGILSPKAFCFETVRKLGGLGSHIAPAVRACARHANQIIAAHSEAVPFLAKLRGRSDGISVLSYYSFSPERLASMRRPAFSDTTGRPLKLFGSGNLEGRKGVAIALHALKLVKDRGVKFAYRYTSQGPELPHLLALARRLGLADDVDLGNPFPRGEYIKELWDTDLYLLPSLREGGGLSMMEAMVAGCVPIVADCGGPGTAATDDCGVRVPVQSLPQMASNIAAAIVRFDSDRKFISRMGQAAERRITETYGEKHFMLAMEACYRAALSQS